MRRLWKIALIALIFTAVSLLIGSLLPPSWIHPSDRDYYTQQ